MLSSDIKAFFRAELISTRDQYQKDLDAMTLEQMAVRPSGTARSVLDITYEVSTLNRRFAGRIRRDDLPPFKMDGWMTAPDDFVAPSAALVASMDEVISAWDATPEDEIQKPIPLANGSTTPMEMVHFAISHTSYHDAQVNYIQSLLGDTSMHWVD